jgi:hypothetical protein
MKTERLTMLTAVVHNRSLPVGYKARGAALYRGER